MIGDLPGDRPYVLGSMRADVITLALKCAAERFENRDGREAVSAEALDLACINLADKLREPEKCSCCGQEVPK